MQSALNAWSGNLFTKPNMQMMSSLISAQMEETLKGSAGISVRVNLRLLQKLFSPNIITLVLSILNIKKILDIHDKMSERQALREEIWLLSKGFMTR